MPFSQDSSVSVWLQGLKDGDADAARKLWARYSEALVAVAERQLRGSPRQAADEEDVAASVFAALCRGAADGRFQDVCNHDELWWLLLALTKRKCVSHRRREEAEKRGGGHVQNASQADEFLAHCFDNLVREEPSAETVLVMQEEFSRLLGLLRDDTLRRIAIWRVEGYSAEDVCRLLGVSASTVTRKLRLIRQTWREELDP